MSQVTQPPWIDKLDIEAEELAYIMEDMIVEKYNTYFEDMRSLVFKIPPK